MNKTLNHDDLFDTPDSTVADETRREIDGAAINEILVALGSRARTPTKQERQDDFINSLPDEAKEGLYIIRRMVGVKTFAEMFYSSTPEAVEMMRKMVNKIDLGRVYKAYHEA